MLIVLLVGGWWVFGEIAHFSRVIHQVVSGEWEERYCNGEHLRSQAQVNVSTSRDHD